jgi:chromosome segregation ATPase
MHYITNKTLFRIKLLLLIGTILITAIVLFDVFSDNSKFASLGKKGKDSKGQQAKFMAADELLHARLWQLQDMDQKFASLLTTQYDQEALVRINASIQYAEESFRKSIDSISRIGVAYDEQSGTNDFQNMTTFFKKILENRRFIAFTRMGILSSGEGSGNEKQTILKLQNELYEKDKMIASSANNKTVVNLQAQLGEKDKQILALEAQIQKAQTEKQEYTQTTQKLQAELTEKDKIIASLGNKKTSPDQKTILNLQNELSVKNKQISDLQAQGQSDKQIYTQTVQKLQNELSEKNKIIASAANKRLPADQKGLVALQSEISTKNKQISDLQTQIQKEQSDKKAYSQTIQKFQSDIVQKNKMIDALSNIKIPTDDKALANLEKEISAKNKQISDLQRELNEKNKTIASGSNTKLPADQKGLISLQNELSAKNKQISTLQAEMKKEAAEKKTYSQTINNLQLELIEKNKIIASAGNRKVPTDQKALVTLQNEIAEKDRRIKRLEDQLLNPSASKSAGGESIKDLQERNTNLRLAYNNTMTQLGLLQKKYNSLKAEMDQVKGQR